MAVASHHVSGSKAFCETEVVLSHSAFTWTIKNLHFCCAQDGTQTFESPRFNSGANQEYSWQLKLRWCNAKSDGKLVSRTTNKTNEIRMLILPSPNIKFAEVKCTLLNVSDKELHNFALEIRQPDFSKQTDERMFPKELPLSLLECFTNDFVKITFEATISHDQVCTFIQGSEIDYEKTPAKFTRYLSSLFDQDRYSDFVVKVQGRKFPSHKAILAANSPVFEAMFEHDFQEKNSALLEITDFEANAVYELLNYMYSHKKPEFASFDSVTKLYEIADKYAVDDLKELCKAHLLSKLDAKNAMDVLGLADKHCETVLRENVLSFIQAHPEINFETVKKETLYEKLYTVFQHGKEISSDAFIDKPKAWFQNNFKY